MTGAWVKAVRESLGDSQPAFANRLTKLAIIDRSPNITSVWAVVAWEKGRREPDEARRKLIEKLAKQVERERNAKEEPGSSLAG